MGVGEKAGLAAGGGTVPSAISTETSAEPTGPLDLVGGWAFIPHVVTGCTAPGHGTSLGSSPQLGPRGLKSQSPPPAVLGVHEKPLDWKVGSAWQVGTYDLWMNEKLIQE